MREAETGIVGGEFRDGGVGREQAKRGSCTIGRLTAEPRRLVAADIRLICHRHVTRDMM